MRTNTTLRIRRKDVFPCQYPDCKETVKSFKRPADLERHYRNVHAKEDQKEKHYCDYPPCRVSRGPFYRKDHCRDHLRDYHKEDIGSPKFPRKERMDNKIRNEIQKAWIAERKIFLDRWRCPKCLHRIMIDEHGYNCNICNHTCDRERADRIKAIRARTTAGPFGSTGMEDVRYNPTTGPTTMLSSQKLNCFTCQGANYIWDESSVSFNLCPTCRPPIDQYYEDEEFFEGGSYTLEEI